MTKYESAQERGIACQMQIEPGGLPHLRQYPGEKAAAIKGPLDRRHPV
jgi:hypothetical protein